MKDTYINAKLIGPDLLRLVIFSSLPWEKLDPIIQKDGRDLPRPTILKTSTLNSIVISDLRLSEPLELGHSYFVVTPQYGAVPVDITEATNFPNFDKDFYYPGNDLGFTYGKKHTDFAIWAPLASKVVLAYRKNEGDSYVLVEMIRCDHGVFKARVEGDLHTYRYHYWVTNNEVSIRATDPYAKGSTVNGVDSVVVDFSRFHTDFKRDCLPVMNSYCDAIVYEGHVRDLTIDPNSTIEHKGTFKGLCEKGRKTLGGHPAGFDYIKSLGITHLQLLPIYDYKTVDETDPKSGYNWGYDPAQYFVPEGSYASDLLDPLSRIRDLKELVATYHEAGIRIVMDVVYNHVYEYQNHTLEKVVPNYYFRHRANGKMASTSGCGDDFASERPMARKMIVDACKHWITEYGVDGFRFDLMGIIDVKTLNMVKDMAKAIDPSFILYGEGWNMGGEVREPLGHMGNYAILPDFGFFNDYYRESLKNYFAEDLGAKNAVKACMTGCCLDFIIPPKFLNANQTVNYVECHDNMTFYDYISQRRKDLSSEERLKIVEAANATVLLSFGIPFIHAGQEIAMSKWGEDNTYNKGDGYNKFSYKLLDERYEMVERFREFVSYRKRASYLRVYDPRIINQAIDVSEVDDAIHLSFLDKNLIAPQSEVHFFINPTYRDKTYWAPNPLEKTITSSALALANEDTHAVTLPSRSVVLARGKKES